MAPGMLTIYPQHPTSLKRLVTHLVIPALAMDAGSSIPLGMDNSYSEVEGRSTMASNLSRHQAMHYEEKSALVNDPSTAETEIINRAIDQFTSRSRRSRELYAGDYLRLHAPAIAHAFGPELANDVTFFLRNGQLHMLYGTLCELEITTDSQLKEALRKIRNSWLHCLAEKRREEFIRLTKPDTAEPFHSARRHVMNLPWIDLEERGLRAGMRKALSLVTDEACQGPGRWHDLQAELEKFWWETLVKRAKPKNVGNSKLSVLFTSAPGPGDPWIWNCYWEVHWKWEIHWKWETLRRYDILNCISAKLRRLPETSPFVRAPFTIEEFDPLRSPTRDGDVTRYADTFMDPDDEWVRISGRASPGESRRALVCPSRTMMAALDLFLSTIDIKDFTKLKGYVPGGDWHARLAHKDRVPNNTRV